MLSALIASDDINPKRTIELKKYIFLSRVSLPLLDKLTLLLKMLGYQGLPTISPCFEK